MTKNKMIGLAAATFLAIPAWSFSFQPPAMAQSFSCAQAQLPSEMAICNSKSLLIKDEQVASLLASKLVTATASGTMKVVSDEHGNWLRVRNSCSNNMACLEAVYDKRILGLTGQDL